MRRTRQRDLEQRPRHDDGREDVRQQAERQRRRKPANRAGAELEEERRGDERRHVRVENREQHAIEPVAHRASGGPAGLQLFLDALEDQHVRIHAHADRQDEAGDARERERRADERQRAQQNRQVRDDRRSPH